MTKQEKARIESNRKILRDLFLKLHDKHPGRGQHFVVARFVAAARNQHQDIIDAGIREAGMRFWGELARQRNEEGFRIGHPVNRGGKQLSLPIFEQSFPEGWITIDLEAKHAAGATERAAYDRFAIELAEERCRERGLDPAKTELLIGAFVTPDEVAVLWSQQTAA